MALRFGRTPLIMAARAGDAAAASALLAGPTGAVGTADEHGFTALYHAAMFGHVEVMRLVLAAGADIGAADLGGLTPLHIACEKGHPAAVLCLLEHGADIGRLDSIGRTPADWAETKGHAEVLAVLQDWRASKSAVPTPTS